MSVTQRPRPQQRLSERLTGSRLNLEVKRSIRPLAMLLVGFAIGIGGFLYIYNHIGAGGATHPVRFAAIDTTGVVPDRAEVRFKNIAAGIVSDVKIEDGKAVVTANVLKKWGTIYKDARAVIRPNTPLQDMYLDIIDRGTPAAGVARPDDVIPASQTNTSVNIADVLQVFQPDVRDRLRTLLTDLGSGLDDRGAQLRQTFVQITPFIDVVGKLSSQLALRADRTKRTVHNVGQLSQILAERDVALRAVIDNSSRVMSATADERVGLDRTLAELPLALQELDASFAAVDRVLPDVDLAATRLQPVVENLPASLAAIREVSDDARPAVQALREPLAELVPLSSSLRPATASLSRSISDLRPQTADLAKSTSAIEGCPNAAYMFFQWTASITKFDDAMGPYPAGDFGFGVDSLAGGKNPEISASPSCAPGGPKGFAP